jgi:NAD(P)-dependent dehydrogenase (short-subunit alcohol dehydrogenase family)
MHIDLAGRKALVTGAAGGIGRAVALEFAAAGAQMALTDVPAASGALTELVAELAAGGHRAVALTADLRDRKAVMTMAAEAEQALGGIDALVNVAGVHLYPSPLLMITEEDWDRVHSINVKAPLLLCQALIPGMARRGRGAVVNVASDSAFDVIAEVGAYGISKISLVRMSAYLAKELAGTGVRVNALAPGWVRTRMSEPFRRDAEVFAQAVAAIPAQRIAEPTDIAHVAAFLVSDLAAYVNGHCMMVDGGRIAGNPA